MTPPKPPTPVYPKPKPQRLPRRIGVTIAAGFRFHGGLALCADTQETVAQAKTWTPKLRLEPQGSWGGDKPDDLMLAITGAGDGPFIDKLTERIWEKIFSSQTLSGACYAAELAIKETYKEFGEIFQPGYLPNADLVFGVKILGNSRLFVANGPIVTEKSKFGIVGAGYYMADFLLGKLHHNMLSGTQAVLLAAYVLFECKEHVDGCGGDSHVAILSDQGRSDLIDLWHVNALTEKLNAVDISLSSLLLTTLDCSLPEEEHKRALEILRTHLINVRAEAQKEDEEWARITSRPIE
jgi:hypothetical protein